MEKIKNYLRNYFQKSSKLKLITDFLFYLLLILVLIPSTRTMLLRVSLFKPKIINQENAVKLSANDLKIILEDMQGNTLDLSEFSGQTIFVNFWATWCPPCRAEMPSMQKFYLSYGGKMPMFLITNEEKSKVEKYLQENEYNLPVYFQKSGASGVLNVNSLPTSFLISHNGEILIQKKGAADWDSEEFRKKIEEILAL